MPGCHIHRKYCSSKCKGRHRKKHDSATPVKTHACRVCGTVFDIGPGQHNKWLCSNECRKASNAKSVREFHKRRPTQEAIYRERSKAKGFKDANSIRFYRWNPDAPRCCESCGESRVTEVAHKPNHNRLGEHRSRANCKWPEKVWVLCPTCHRLLDRIGYEPEQLGLIL